MNYILSTALGLLLLVSVSCQNRQSNPNTSQNPTVFSSPEEAVKKAQRDFVALLRSGVAGKSSLDSGTVARARPGNAFRQVLLNFNKLQQPNRFISLDSVVQLERNTLTPLLIDNRIVTIVEVTRREKGWSVAALGNPSVTNDINTLSRRGSEAITVYEVPNLNTRVYGVQTATGSTQYFTDYKEFTLSQAVPLEQLYQRLRQDAQVFQRRYGDQLKKRHLVR